MKIPQEIQDLMPESKPLVHDVNWAEGYNAAVNKVEAVLPQMLALAEKRVYERGYKDYGQALEDRGMGQL